MRALRAWITGCAVTLLLIAGSRPARATTVCVEGITVFRWGCPGYADCEFTGSGVCGTAVLCIPDIASFDTTFCFYRSRGCDAAMTSTIGEGKACCITTCVQCSLYGCGAPPPPP